ncbi:A disintegrin and metalloproteinase with thrombospondin motifs like [Argopecten irradians]|uniref:A disintegrin and metalloproteinase with thrombospondin motifs like n=1 Tax=Argopecten irradians TaxID=31199 RepID=UPI00372431A4
MMEYLVLLFLILTPNAFCFKLFEENDSEDSEIVGVEIDSAFTNPRYRRSQEIDFPGFVDYKLSVKGNSKLLHLRKTTHLDKDIPVYRITKERELLLHDVSSEEKAYATYQDRESGASILLHCDKTSPSCSLYGGFYHEGEHFRIQPHSPGTQNHRIAKTTRPMVAYHDTKLHEDVHSSDIPLAHDVIRRRTASNGNNHVVELLVFLDDTIYDFFYTLSDGNETETLAKMKMYYILIANDMDLRYQSLSERHKKFKVNIMINGFVYSQVPEGFAWIPHYIVDEINNVFDADNSMEMFADYQYHNRQFLPGYDHAMQFTRRDLAFYEDGWQTDLLGVAFKGTTCSVPKMAVSIIEDSSYGTTGQTAAHELGHSLGSSHDGAAGCNDDKQYIMAAFTNPSTKKVARHMWKMSSCSSDAIYKFLNSMGNNGCTKTNSFVRKDYTKYHGLASGGQIYDLDTQCQLRQGKLSFSCQEANPAICSEGIYCKIENTNFCRRILAMEGSDCGKGNICHEGKCLHQESKVPRSLVLSRGKLGFIKAAR